MKKPKTVIVAVDGPAGSGKSSISGKVCERLGFTFVNTGILYRAVAYFAKLKGVDLNDENSLLSIANQIIPDLSWDPMTKKLWCQGDDLSTVLLSSEAAAGASLVAKSGKVRTALLPLQRKLALMSPKGSILEGRDIGTVVFPDADLKIFLTASLEERARRRIQQLAHEGTAENINLPSMMEKIRIRDEQDSARAVAPLKKADDAIELDTSNLDQEGVIAAIIGLIKDKKLA